VYYRYCSEVAAGGLTPKHGSLPTYDGTIDEVTADV